MSLVSITMSSLTFTSKSKCMMLHCLKRLSYNSISSNASSTNSQIKLEKIHHFGLLYVHGRQFNSFIKPIDPHKYPNGDRASVKLLNNHRKLEINNLVSVYYDESCGKLAVTSKVEDACNSIDLEICVPHNFDIDVLAKDVNIRETEGHKIKVQSINNCKLGKIKSFQVDITAGGYLECKGLYGNGTVTSKGSLSIGKLQTNDIDIKCDNNINITDVYSNQISCKALNGNVNITNLHGNAHINMCNGNAEIGSSSGDLNIKTTNGNINVVLETFNECNIKTTNGNVDVGFSDSVATFIDAQATFIDIPEDLLIDGLKRESDVKQFFEGNLGDGKSNLKVKSTNGNIVLSRKNWFSKYEHLD